MNARTKQRELYLAMIRGWDTLCLELEDETWLTPMDSLDALGTRLHAGCKKLEANHCVEYPSLWLRTTRSIMRELEQMGMT